MHLALLIMLLAVAGCDGSKTTVSKRIEPTPPPAQTTGTPTATGPALPGGDHALKAVAEVLPADVDVVVATSSPRALASTLGMTEPSSESTIIGKRMPGFDDLHPSRLALYGLDPDRPAGFFKRKGRPGDVDPWGVFAHIKDVQLTTWHLKAREQPPAVGDGERVKRYRLEPSALRLTIVGDIAVITYLLSAESRHLADEERFRKLGDALDYSGLVTAYVAGDEPTLLGLGIDEQGVAARAVSTTLPRARTAVEQWPAHVYGASLDARRDRALDLLEMKLTPEKLEANKKLRAANDELAKVDERIAELRAEPARRKNVHLVAAFKGLDAQAEGSATSADVHIYTRIVGSDEFVGALIAELETIGLTDDEHAELVRLEKRQNALRRELVAEIGGLQFFGETRKADPAELMIRPR